MPAIWECVAKESISQPEMGSFASRKAPYHAPIKPISHADMVLFAKQPRLRRVYESGKPHCDKKQKRAKKPISEVPDFLFRDFILSKFFTSGSVYLFISGHTVSRTFHASGNRVGLTHRRRNARHKRLLGTNLL